MLDQDLPEVIEKALMRQTQGEHILFDVISIQFALHYAFASEACLLLLLQNISRLLVPGTGQLIVTSVDARCLAHHLQQARREGEFGNAVYNVKFSSEAMAKIRKEDGTIALDALGLRYTFTLSSAVEACDEYVVHLPSLTRLAREEAGLELIYHRNFGQFVKDQLPHYGHLLEPLQVGQVSLEEWEAINIYAATIFQRSG
jgi:mRNA (guanine-N7-)-methyltransferase